MTESTPSGSVEADQLADVVNEALETTGEALKSTEEMISQIETILNDIPDGGISLYDLKNHELSAYLLNMSSLMAKMTLCESIEGSPAVDQLIKLRVIFERIRPIEKKLKNQVDQLLKDGDDGNKELTMHARPEMFEEDSEEEEEDDKAGSGEDEDDKQGKQQKYQAPKTVPMHFDENAEEKRLKQVERARKRAMQSSLIQDLRAQYSDAPVLIRDGPAPTRMQEEQRKFEEHNYVRLQLNKHEKRMTRRKENLDTLDSLLKFGDYNAMDVALAGGQSGKKARGAKRRAGPGAKKKPKRRKH